MQGQPHMEGGSLLPRSPDQLLDLRVSIVKKEVDKLPMLPLPSTWPPLGADEELDFDP